MRNIGVPSSVWHRRTNRMIAATVIVIGLTMMISNITQCIYIGMLFIIIALAWLAWLTMKERKLEPPHPSEDQPSPVLFLVTSHMLPRVNHPTAVNPSDKPPSYDQIISLDGLPPDYSSVIPDPEKPPCYEDLTSQQLRMNTSVEAQQAAGPSFEQSSEGGSDCYPAVDSIRHKCATFTRASEMNGISREVLNRANSNTARRNTTTLNRLRASTSSTRGIGNSGSSSLRRHESFSRMMNKNRKRHSSGGSTTASQYKLEDRFTSDVPLHKCKVTINTSSSSIPPLRLHASTLKEDVAGCACVTFLGKNRYQKRRKVINQTTAH